MNDPSSNEVAAPTVVDHPAPLGDLADIFLRRRIGVGTDSGGQVVLARPDSLLVDGKANGQGDRVRELVRDPELATRITGTDQGDATGVITLRLAVGDPTSSRRERRWSLTTALEVQNVLARNQVQSELNHVFLGAQTVVGNPLGAPASWAGEMAFTGRTVTTNGAKSMLTTAEPTVPPAFLRDPLRIDGFRQPKVLVLDTGLRTDQGAGVRAEHDALDCCSVHKDWVVSRAPGVVDDEDETDDDSTGTLDFEAGHGTFISGVIRQVCPDVHIDNAGVLSSFGDGDVSGVLAAIERMAVFGPYDIVVMSFGAFFAEDEPGMFGTALMSLLGDAVGVSAAGNQGTCRPYFPAGLTDVIAVGGLAADGKAWFSNFGGWVDACAPAVDVVSTFFEDFPETIDGELHRQYNGWARWSGTSFSAPKVAAVIAQEMYLNQVTAKEAWKRVTSHKHLRYPDLGIVFNV